MGMSSTIVICVPQAQERVRPTDVKLKTIKTVKIESPKINRTHGEQSSMELRIQSFFFLLLFY